jgi:hypothetical protein
VARSAHYLILADDVSLITITGHASPPDITH